MADNKKLLKAAEKSPEDFNKQLNAYFKKNKELSADFLCFLFLRMIKRNTAHAVEYFLPRLIETISMNQGIQSAYNILSRLEVALNFRKPSIGLYDNSLHFIGGAQKYGCTLAHALQNDFDITFISNKSISLPELEKWYNLDLSHCPLKIIKIPFFEEDEQEKILVDPADVDLKKDNPFHIISKESGNYDIFINNCMLEMVYPMANISVFIVHFPERERSRFFYVDKYTEIIHNSLYTAEWIKKKWDLIPHKHIYPPVDMDKPDESPEKEDIILSCSRFDPGGNKQQAEMVKVFGKLIKLHPDTTKGWKLVLTGGSIAENRYLEKIKKMMSQSPELKIELRINVAADELKTIYQKAKIFWHFTGLNQLDPAKVEHFGMTIAEAMQNGCVPVVFNGGGQTEIVEDQVSGFLFSSETDLIDRTIKLMDDSNLMDKLSQNVYQRGKQFHKNIFIDDVRKHFNQLLEDYCSIDLSYGENSSGS